MTDAEITPEAPAQEATTPQPQVEQQETFDREYVEKLRRENASYRQRAKEAQEAAEAAKLAAEREKLDEVERLKAEKADLEKAAAEAKALAIAAERRASLTGRVVDIDLAMAVADKYVTEDGTLDVDALLTAHPALKAAPAGPTPVGGAGGTLKSGAPNPWAKATRNLTEQARIHRENPALAQQLKEAAQKE